MSPGNDGDRPRAYVVDTNVLIDNPDAIFDLGRRPQDRVIITDTVLAELDGLKRGEDTSVNARRVIAKLMRLSDQEVGDLEGIIHRGDLLEGVHLGIRERTDEGGRRYVEGGMLQLYNLPPRSPSLSFAPSLGQADLSIIRACKAYAAKNRDVDVVLITGDKNMVIVARANGITAQHREGENLSTDNLYKGHRVIEDPAAYSQLIASSSSKRHSDRRLPVSTIDAAWAHQLVGNEYIVFSDESSRQAIVQGRRVNLQRIFRYHPVERELRGIAYTLDHPLKAEPQNTEQILALDAMLDDEVKLTVLLGIAGGGKTYLALAVAMYRILQVRNERNLDARIYVTKRNVTVGGEEYGFLPGELDEKVIHQYHAIDKNWQKLIPLLSSRRDITLGMTLKEALRDPVPLIEIIPFGYLRGMTFGDDDIVIVEEIQNIQPREMKPVLTRIGRGNVYCTGDIYQPDNPLVRVDYNGANFTIDRIVKTEDPTLQKLLSTVTFRRSERSPLSSWAAHNL